MLLSPANTSLRVCLSLLSRLLLSPVNNCSGLLLSYLILQERVENGVLCILIHTGLKSSRLPARDLHSDWGCK